MIGKTCEVHMFKGPCDVGESDPSTSAQGLDSVSITTGRKPAHEKNKCCFSLMESLEFAYLIRYVILYVVVCRRVRQSSAFYGEALTDRDLIRDIRA